MSGPTTGEGPTFEAAIFDAISKRKSAGLTDERGISIINHVVRLAAIPRQPLWHTVDTVRVA